VTTFYSIHEPHPYPIRNFTYRNEHVAASEVHGEIVNIMYSKLIFKLQRSTILRILQVAATRQKMYVRRLKLGRF